MPAPVLFIALALAGLPDLAWEEDGYHAITPCADSLASSGEGDDEDYNGGIASGSNPWRVPVAGEDCDPDEALLFLPDPQDHRPESRSSSRASFSIARNSEQGTQSTLRHQATRDGWDHHLEIRDETLTRRWIGWRGGEHAGWRLIAGDLTDTALPLWPRVLPRRTLPRGWRPARGTPDAPRPFSAPVPQGFAAGVMQPRWKAYALRSWNPVETGMEPPWRAAWNLRHHAAGASVSLPWTASLQVSETRITRGAADSLSERLFAAELASPGGSVDLIAARTETDGETNRVAAGAMAPGWLLGAALRHRFENAATLAFTARQRDGGWASAWDPGFTPAASGEAADRGPEAGAGEVRLAGRLPLGGAGEIRDDDAGFASAETWRTWNPPAGTNRQGVRAAFGWRRDGARLEVSGTHRSARAASGSVSLYRYLEAETRLESGPRWRIAAWRAWTGAGPLRAGIFAGAEPALGPLRLSPGYRLEERLGERSAARWEGFASLGLRARTGTGWSLDFAGTLPCWPSEDAGSAGRARWRATLNYAGR